VVLDESYGGSWDFEIWISRVVDAYLPAKDGRALRRTSAKEYNNMIKTPGQSNQ